jgi:hypothetical protein
LPDAYDPEAVSQVGELDELETFVGTKKTRVAKLAGETSAPDLPLWFFRLLLCLGMEGIHNLIENTLTPPLLVIPEHARVRRQIVW